MFMSVTGEPLADLTGRPEPAPVAPWFKQPRLWFCLALLLGLVVRIYLAYATLGTNDVNLWEWHAYRVRDVGVVRHYHDGKDANHPPLISAVQAQLLRLADASGVSYRVLLRMPFALFDAGSVVLLLLILKRAPRRYFIAGAYWLNPVALILSAYHGNTDSAVAFFLLLGCRLLSKQHLVGAAAAIGASAWIKIPGLMAVPAFVLFIQGWKRRALFLGMLGVVGLAGYLPWLLDEPGTVLGNVFGYRGGLIGIAGIPIWGPRTLLFSVIAAPDRWPTAAQAPILFFLRNSWVIALGVVALFFWLRRGLRSVLDLCATIGGGYIILYALIDNWTFQYLAWSLPFWFFLPRPWSIALTSAAAAYIYSLYWFFCGNAWLLGPWDFAGHPVWPSLMIALRNLTVLMFMTSALALFVGTLKQQWRTRPERTNLQA